MGKKQKHTNLKTKTVSNVKDSGLSLFEKIELFFDKKHHITAIFITVLSLLFSLLMFDAKVSTGYDDSTYIKVGYLYSQDFFNYFFTSQAPLFGMVLALPVSIFGINIIALKLFNVFLFSTTIYVLYRALRFKVSWLLLMPALFIYATNSEALKYASLTYNETFFALVQSAFLIFVIKLITAERDIESDIKSIFINHKWSWIAAAFLFYFLFQARTVGVASIVAILVYFVSKKMWRWVLVTVVVFGVTVFGMDMVKNGIWSDVEHFSVQTQQGLQVDPYDASKGMETFDGFVDRFFTNSQLYVSSRLMEILGFRDYPAPIHGGLTFLLVLLVILALILSYKKEKSLYFLILYFGALLGFTFIAVQISWGQGRYIMVYLPFIMMAIFYVFYRFFNTEKTKSFQFFGILLMAIFAISNLKFTLSKFKETIPIAKANLLKGDKYAGFTPDWENYLKMSEWCAANLEKGSKVACRKESMSYLYGNGFDFYPIYKAPDDLDPEEAYNILKENKVTHVIVANLRVNPKLSSSGIINTIHRYMQTIINKYPAFLTEVHKIGDSEEAVLYKLNYND